MNTNIPIGVKITAFFYYIAAAITIISALSALLLSLGLFGVSVQGDALGLFFGLFGGFMLGVVIITLLIAALTIFIGRSLWKGKNWARILTIIFAILFLLGSIGALIQGEEIIKNLVILGISTISTGYLVLSKDAKNYFHRINKSGVK